MSKELIDQACDCCGYKSPFLIRFPAEQLSPAYYIICGTCEKDLLQFTKRLQMLTSVGVIGIVLQALFGYHQGMPMTAPRSDKTIEQVTH